MTVPQIKVKVVRRPQIKVKSLVKFPANVIATPPLTLTNIGGTYTFGIDYSLFGSGTFTPGAIPFAGPLGGLTQDTGLSWDNTLKALTGTSIISSGNLSLGGANTFAFTGRTVIQSGSDGNLTLRNSAGTDFTSLKFGGTTASFPEIKRNATAVNFRLADDSADAPITAASFNGNFITTGTGTLTLTGNLTVNSATAISAGVTGQVGVWNAGNLSGSATPTLGASGTLGSVTFGNATSGLLTLRAVTGALGAVTVSLPAATDTLIGKATTDTLTNKTFDTAGAGNSFSINGVAVTANTGTGAVARAAGPTFTTPTLGAATATSINGNTFTTGTYTLTGTAAKTLTFNNSLTLAGTDATTITFQGTDTYVGRATTDTLTNKTYDTSGAGNSFMIASFPVTSTTGTGAVVVRQTSPSLITPALGTPTSGTLTNCTGLPLAGLAAQAAFTFVGNNTAGSAVPTAVDIATLTSKASPTASDLVIISDQAASGAWKKATVSSISSAGSVSSLNGNTGAINFSVVQQKFLASGTYTPTTGMVYCVIECVGGGGAGGGTAGGTTVCDAGGGGGSGGYSRLVASAATIGASKAVTIGAGGTAGTAGNNPGNNGGDTSVGVLCIAKGGTGGSGNTGGRAGQGGAGGIAGTGDYVPTGNPGYMAIGGASTIFTVYGGAGAPSYFGGAGQSLVKATNGSLNGSAGTSGGGGSGGVTLNSASNSSGGAGGDGVVIVTEYVVH